MNFEMDRLPSEGTTEVYNIYANMNCKKRCIGRLEHQASSGLWNVYADGNLLCAAAGPQEGAGKLWELYRIQHPDQAGFPRKPIEECTVEERFFRVRRRIPRNARCNEPFIKEARNIPVDRRISFIEEVDELICDLEEQLYLWRKVREEARKTPRFTVYR